ncbi:MAG: hypothetical protein ABIT04_01705 [Novosphingobium sp.]
MNSVDFPGVIQAAAGSPLGVLSLIILAVALIAWAFFKGSDDRVKLGVFAAILLAAIVFGFATMREGNSAEADLAKPLPSETASPPQPATEAPAPVALAAAASSKAVAPDPAPADISGAWRDGDEPGITYRVTVADGRLSYVQFLGSQPLGSGAGTIDGRQLDYGYVVYGNGDTGRCKSELSPDGTTMAGICTSISGQSWRTRTIR